MGYVSLGLSGGFMFVLVIIFECFAYLLFHVNVYFCCSFCIVSRSYTNVVIGVIECSS